MPEFSCHTVACGHAEIDRSRPIVWFRPQASDPVVGEIFLVIHRLPPENISDATFSQIVVSVVTGHCLGRQRGAFVGWSCGIQRVASWINSSPSVAELSPLIFGSALVGEESLNVLVHLLIGCACAVAPLDLGRVNARLAVEAHSSYSRRRFLKSVDIADHRIGGVEDVDAVVPRRE
ncbi:hypothetical protein [Microbacterium sp. A93]|uniref:hypothetical protein n=1 Tax=Microbacterium sp. A93 TaxID=3450716 RepID=UPI003F43ABFC